MTLVELLTVLVVMSVLATLMIRAAKQPRDAVERIGCISNLRSLHIALNSYITDHKQWPQEPANVDDTQLADWWTKALSPYLSDKRAWECPTYQRLRNEDPGKTADHGVIDYIPTRFDSLPMTPFKWPNMPWGVELGDFHGSGNLAVFSDGSVRTIWEAYLLQNPGGALP